MKSPLACKYGPAAPETWETYVYYLANLGRKEGGRTGPWLSAKEKTPRGQAPHNPQLIVTFSSVTLPKPRSNTCSPKRTVRATKASRRIWPVFILKRGAEPNKAEPILKEFLDAWDTAPEQKAWARRNMAMILAIKKDYREVQKALELFEVNRKSNALIATPNGPTRSIGQSLNHGPSCCPSTGSHSPLGRPEPGNHSL